MSTRTTAEWARGGRLSIAENATLRLPAGRFPTLISVERGTLLVTQEGDLEDHVLESGDEIVLPVGGLAIAWAFSEAAISVRHVPLALDWSTSRSLATTGS